MMGIFRRNVECNQKENGNMWAFRKSEAIEQPTFNGILNNFVGLGCRALVRENIQNSLDAKNPASDLPVKVIIKIGDMNRDQIPGLQEIEHHISSLKAESASPEETIRWMKRSLEEHKETVTYISFEDCNTNGLTGAAHGEQAVAGDTWGAYAYKRGVHHTDANDETERQRGGSHGVGKIANNAASDLYMMFFANCDAHGEQHLGGTVELIEHELDGEIYRSTGYFTNKDNSNKYYPYENKFGKVFAKDTRGLKLVIPFLREQYNDKKEIIKTVCDNFFVAILSSRLEVLVNDIVINRDTILSIVQNKEYYEIQEYEEMRNEFTPLYVQTYLNQKPEEIIVTDKKENEYHFKLYFTYDSRITRGKYVVVRSIGMKIEEKSIKNKSQASFNAVLIPCTSKEDVFLKGLENESHTSISEKRINNPEESKNATRFINNLDKKIKEKYDEISEAEAGENQKMDTSDIIYLFNNDFKNNTKTKKKTKSRTPSNGKNDVFKEEQPDDSDPEKERQHGGERRESNSNKILISTKYIKRLVLNDKEFLQITFPNRTQYIKDKNQCNVHVSVIDGAGNLIEEGFNLGMNYKKVVDGTSGTLCEVEDNIIKNVTLDKRQINLEMDTSNKFNHSLKFRYYVEV